MAFSSVLRREKLHADYLVAFQKSGFWMKDHWGPKPGEPECRVPASIIEAAGAPP